MHKKPLSPKSSPPLYSLCSPLRSVSLFFLKCLEWAVGGACSYGSATSARSTPEIPTSKTKLLVSSTMFCFAQNPSFYVSAKLFSKHFLLVYSCLSSSRKIKILAFHNIAQHWRYVVFDDAGDMFRLGSPRIRAFWGWYSAGKTARSRYPLRALFVLNRCHV